MRFHDYIPNPPTLLIIRGWLTGTLAGLVLVLAYAVAQLNDDLAEARQKEAVQSALLCPPRLGGMIFTHSGFTKLDLARPGSARLSCYYSRGVKG